MNIVEILLFFNRFIVLFCLFNLNEFFFNLELFINLCLYFFEELNIIVIGEKYID